MRLKKRQSIKAAAKQIRRRGDAPLLDPTGRKRPPIPPRGYAPRPMASPHDEQRYRAVTPTTRRKRLENRISSYVAALCPKGLRPSGLPRHPRNTTAITSSKRSSTLKTRCFTPRKKRLIGGLTGVRIEFAWSFRGWQRSYKSRFRVKNAPHQSKKQTILLDY